MSTKELVYSLIDALDEEQLEAIAVFLKKFSSSRFPEVEPDEWDLEMMKRAEEENDGETVTLEEFAERLGIDLDEK